jgi:hypothetical protein
VILSVSSFCLQIFILSYKITWFLGRNNMNDAIKQAPIAIAYLDKDLNYAAHSTNGAQT